jgi:fructose-1,6-bisphosphatase/sedoheptulose 1,7-bisphosphatase-like protein
MSNGLEKEGEVVIGEEEVHENPMLAMTVDKNSKLKEMLVEYVGTKLDNEEVTVNMVAEVLAAEFPEFVFAFAEENFLRGYQLGLDDADKLRPGITEETA